MKTVALSILGIGAPLVLMMGAWMWWSAAPDDEPQPRLIAENVAPIPSRSESAATRIRPPEPSHAPQVTTPPIAAIPLKLTEVVENWTERWQDRARSRPDVQLDLAMVHLAHGQYADSLRAFDRLLLAAPDDPEILTGKAVALVGLDRADDALPLFEHAIERDPDDAAIRLNYALALTRSGDQDGAAQAYEALLNHNPAHPPALFNLATLYQATGRAFDALEVWTQLTDVLETAPRPAAPDVDSQNDVPNDEMHAAAWFHRGELAIALSRLEESERCFGRVVEIHPDDAPAWCNLGIVRARRGRRDEAIIALNEAVRLDASLIPAMNQLAYVHAGLFRDTGDIKHRDAVVHWCARSLERHADQPNLRDLRIAIGSVTADADEGLDDAR